MKNFKLSRYTHIATDNDILPEKSIVYSTRSGVALELSNQMVNCIKIGDLSTIKSNILAKLIKMEILVPEDQNELEYILNLNKADVNDTDKKRLSYIIQPTANCQLGCHYCGQVHTKKSLTKDTLELIYNRIKDGILKNKQTLKTFNLTWYGGEPLTGLSGLKELSTKVMALCKELKIFYQADMITNGLLLKPHVFEDLVTNFKVMAYQVTIDGTQEFHDKRRMLKNNNPSFNLILNNIEKIVNSEFYKKSNAKIAIRSNVDGENKTNVFELMKQLYDKNILDKVSFYISPIHDWGDTEATKINGISKEEFAQLEIDVYLELNRYGLLNKNKILPSRNTSPCMVVSQTSEVMDAYGNVSTCWEIPYTPAYDNTSFISGNLHSDDVVSTANAPMRDWFNEIPTNDSWCKGCKFLPVCGGSCPKNWYQGTPACPSFKFNIDERLFLKKIISNN